jgi:hypothetical protein
MQPKTHRDVVEVMYVDEFASRYARALDDWSSCPRTSNVQGTLSWNGAEKRYV